MNDEVVRCSICGGVMELRGSVPTKFGRLKRYRCTCGHHTDLKDEEAGSQRHLETANVMPEGIQELV